MPGKKMKLTLYQRHRERFKDGCGSEMCSKARHVVFARGSIPADVLFVGEAPGQSEDCTGIPFAPGAPAGSLLNHIITEAGLQDAEGRVLVRYAIYNLVGCMPRNEEAEDSGGKVKDNAPPDSCIKQCRPKLEDFIKVVNPRLIVCVGKLPAKWLDPDFKQRVKLPRFIPQIHIIHPAYILRANAMQRDMAIRRCIIQVRQAVEEYVIRDGIEE